MNAEVREGITLEYDTFGDPSDPPLLLVMGLGFQLIHWDPEFCERPGGASTASASTTATSACRPRSAPRQMWPQVTDAIVENTERAARAQEVH